MVYQHVNINKIKGVRESLGISIEEMSKRMGFASYQGYYKKEAGLRQFSATDVSKISVILDIPISDIFFSPEVTEKETYKNKNQASDQTRLA
ncbi:helix-turn-helix transcriptional regulator [Macrococcoides canis]|uniref:helix-turn-helix transcriptional regulator n=1 Tax=Macrococcoides canis TaxID=1855823 RepID=UPI00165DA285|nr:helix-turn-helix transcriptional regulator [Macrococcus canis]QNR07762.1 helix-turn-helix domain-containing protein [Macrococcus canis]